MRGLIGAALVLSGALLGAGAMATQVRARVDVSKFDIRGAGQPTTVVLTRDGGLVLGGEDNARARVSSSLRNRGLDAVMLAAFEGDDAQWRGLLQCVRTRYRSYNVSIMDRVPEQGDYILAAVGGLPDQLSLPPTVGGIAPHNGNVISNAVVFVFQTEQASVEDLCQTTAHEIGHALGLDHTRLCSDVMSYEACGSKRFQEGAAPCGEWEARVCDSGEEFQNSDAILRRNVGRRSDAGAELLQLVS